MPARDAQAEPAPREKEIQFHRSEEARSEIILKASLQRAVFVAGLVGAVALAVMLSLFALAP
jgi:hypothetical protein